MVLVKRLLLTARVLLVPTSEPQGVCRALATLHQLLEPLALTNAIARRTFTELLIPLPRIPVLSATQPVHALDAPILDVFVLNPQPLPLLLLIVSAQKTRMELIPIPPAPLALLILLDLEETHSLLLANVTRTITETPVRHWALALLAIMAVPLLLKPQPMAQQRANVHVLPTHTEMVPHAQTALLVLGHLPLVQLARPLSWVFATARLTIMEVLLQLAQFVLTVVPLLSKLQHHQLPLLLLIAHALPTLMETVPHA